MANKRDVRNETEAAFQVFVVRVSPSDRGQRFAMGAAGAVERVATLAVATTARKRGSKVA